jgi:uncharacterized protein (TIGR00251 family)
MWYTVKNQQVILQILAKPNARKTALVAIDDSELHISIHASPHHGEANKALIIFLAELFNCPKSQIILKKGELNRHKQVIMPLTESVEKKLDELAR